MKPLLEVFLSQNWLKTQFWGVDNRLDFDEHVETACVQDNKLTALAAASPYMSGKEEEW